MRTRVAFQLRRSSALKLSSALALCANATMRVRDRSITVLGAPRADQHRFRRNFEGLGPMGDAMNKACAAWVRARGIPARALLCTSTLDKNPKFQLAHLTLEFYLGPTVPWPAAPSPRGMAHLAT